MSRRLILAALLALPLAHALAHPHVFIANRMTLVFSGEALQGISFRWTFDEMFSAQILADFKADQTGRFTAADAKALREAAFDNLENYHYFVAFTLGGKPLGGLSVEQFTPSVVDRDRLVYTFFMPLSVVLTAADQTLGVVVYDDSYFTAFNPVKVEDVAVKTPDSVACGLSVGKKKVPEAWPGQYMPDQLVVRFRKK